MENKIMTRGIDIVIYALIIISLCAGVYHLINIAFSVIDFKWGESLVKGGEFYDDSVRFSMATLIVTFPIYFGLSVLVSKLVAKDVTRNESKARKFTLFLSIFITTVTLIGSLISIIYKFLGGELTLAFALKVLFIIKLAVLIGGYYLYTLYRDMSKKSYITKIFAWVSILLVVVSIIWGIVVFGTPSEIRAKKLDSSRLSDISALQNQVLYYWQEHKVLPENLTQLNDPFQGFAVPVDPKTKEPYTYTIKKQSTLATVGDKKVPGDAMFSLCANFQTERKIEGFDLSNNGVTVSVPTQDGSGSSKQAQSFTYYYEGDTNPFWNHSAGAFCFERTITKEMYQGR